MTGEISWNVLTKFTSATLNKICILIFRNLRCSVNIYDRLSVTGYLLWLTVSCSTLEHQLLGMTIGNWVDGCIRPRKLFEFYKGYEYFNCSHYSAKYEFKSTIRYTFSRDTRNFNTMYMFWRSSGCCYTFVNFLPITVMLWLWCWCICLFIVLLAFFATCGVGSWSNSVTLFAG